MNKTKKSCILAVLSLFVLMMTAASVNADENDEPGILDRTYVASDIVVENVSDDSAITGAEPNLIAPSPNTDEEISLISPSSDEDLGPLIIAPINTMENEDESSADNTYTAGLILVIGISGIVGLVAGVIIFKK